MNRAKGYDFEQQAVQYLESKEYIILEQNWHASKFGEIDIIALTPDKQKVVFIEVKGRKGYYSRQDAVNSLTPSKLTKITKSINYFLQNYKKIELPFWTRFDIILIHQALEHIENIDLSGIIN